LEVRLLPKHGPPDTKAARATTRSKNPDPFKL
jgi:hypothetical protein